MSPGLCFCDEQAPGPMCIKVAQQQDYLVERQAEAPYRNNASDQRSSVSPWHGLGLSLSVAMSWAPRADAKSFLSLRILRSHKSASAQLSVRYISVERNRLPVTAPHAVPHRTNQLINNGTS